MIWRNFRRLLATWMIFPVWWLLPKRDKDTLWAIVVVGTEISKSIERDT